MDSLLIKGSVPLHGDVAISGAKNFLICDALKSNLAYRIPGSSEVHDFSKACHTGSQHFDRAQAGGRKHVGM